jgi:hypothetical protein
MVFRHAPGAVGFAISLSGLHPQKHNVPPRGKIKNAS